MDRQKNIALIVQSIRNYPDFPKPGILFRDLFGVMGDAEALAALFAVIKEDCQDLQGKIKAVVGLDSRGFLIGPQIALQLQVPFIPIRKKGKLPGKTLSVTYDLEYGSDTLEVQTELLSNPGSVLIVDDLLATGGTLKAAISLIEQLKCRVERCYIIMELMDLKARDTIPHDIHSIVKF